MKITDSITIKAPLDKVFNVFTDLEKATERVKSISKLEVLEGPGLLQVGTKWRETRTMFGKEATEEMWVTALEPNASYEVAAESQGTKYLSRYQFTQNGEATEVSLVFEGMPLTASAKLMNALGFLFAGAAKKALHKDLEDLKAVCENPS